LGLFVTGHPFDEYEKEVRKMARTKLANIQADKKPQKIAGIIVAQRVMKTKRGGNMAILTVDDRSGRLDVRLFSDVYDKFRDKMIVDHLVVLEVEVKHDNYNDSLGANLINMWNISEARCNFSSGIRLTLKHHELGQHFVRQLNDTLQPFQAQGSPVLVQYHGETAKANLQLGQEYKVEPSYDLLYRLKNHYGEDSVECCYD
jgi:DNA polymerase-3 subunit alpha